MDSRLNVLVNEINSLGVKQIEETELNRKILHSLRRPDYDLMTSILYEKELKTNTKSSPQQGDRPRASQRHQAKRTTFFTDT
jgi:hypothetical protein